MLKCTSEVRDKKVGWCWEELTENCQSLRSLLKVWNKNQNNAVLHVICISIKLEKKFLGFF